MRLKTQRYLVTSLSSFALLLACSGDDGSPSTSVAMTVAGTMSDTSADTNPDDNDNDMDADATADETADPDVDVDMDAEATAEADMDMDVDVDATDTGPMGDNGVFRFASINVRDPHFWADTLLGCVDVTDMAPLNMAGVNDQFNEAINTDMGPDDMPDGNLDLSLMLIFRGLDQADGATGDLDFANGTCPVGGGDCTLLAGSELYPSSYGSSGAGPCENIVASDLSNYDPAPGTTPGPCFSAGPANVEIVTSSFTLPLEMTEIAATYTGDPATSLMSGTLRGFLTTAAAEATILPADLQMSTGAMNVGDLLAGDPDSCAQGDDTDNGGWWFYADFTALGSTWVGP